MNIRCSLVIRAYNEARHLGRLLEGIASQTIRDVELILVDSGSSDETVAIALAGGAKVIHIDPKEFTFGRSLNLGMQAASNEYVVIASAHVHPTYSDWMERLLEPFTDPDVALSYGRQRGGKSARFSERQVFNRWYPEESNSRRKLPFCNNANAAVRRSLWQIQPYDETLTGLEDLAWGKWALSQGHLLAYVAEAEVIHVHEESPRGVFNRYRREAMAFKYIYPEVHFNAYDFFRNVFSSIAFDGLHAIRQHCFWKSFASILWFRWMQFTGTYLGYRQSNLLTPELRQIFYYHVGWQKSEPKPRDIKPIRYNE